jgi:hypothetical protein
MYRYCYMFKNKYNLYPGNQIWQKDVYLDCKFHYPQILVPSEKIMTEVSKLYHAVSTKVIMTVMRLRQVRSFELTIEKISAIYSKICMFGYDYKLN